MGPGSNAWSSLGARKGPSGAGMRPSVVVQSGAVAAPAVAALSRVLDDENRYVSSHTMAALQRIGTPEAEAVMLDFLSTARWCPLTTKERSS